MDSYFYFIQIVGFFAFGLSLLSYQFKKQKTMFAIRVCSDLLWAFHYALLLAVAPALTVAVAALRTFFIVFIFPQQKIKIIFLAVGIVCFLCYWSANGEWQSYLPILAAIVYGMSNYYHDNYWYSRILMLLGLLVWILIGIVFGSYAEIISSSVGAVFLLWSFIRHLKIDNRINTKA